MKHHFTTGNPLNLIEISKFGLVVCLVSLAGLSGCNKATDPAGAATSAAANPGGTPSGTTPSTAGGNVAGANAPGGSTPSSQATASQAGATSAPSGAPGSAPGKGPSGPSGAGAPPVSVTTVRAQQRDLAVQVQATGAVTPVSVVDVRSQVSSVVTQVHIKEGQFVQKGQPLFTLDSRSDEANVAKARAQLTKDEAALADAQRQLAKPPTG